MSRVERCKPFRIIPWTDDFLLRIRELTDELTDGHTERAVLVFPHNRPRRYLLDIYHNSVHTPTLLPQIITGTKLSQLCLEGWSRIVPHTAETLDQVAILRQSILSVGEKEKHGTLADLVRNLRAEDGMAKFFPWGIRLAHLLDECDANMADAKDIYLIDDLVESYAVPLLENLNRIQSDYHARLHSLGLSTPGIEAKKTALLANESPNLPPKLQGKCIILAGFVLLTRAEDTLFHYLWEHGAEVCLHTDPQIINGNPHWSCTEHHDWLNRWSANCVLLGNCTEQKPNIHFCAGYDLHSQLLDLNKELLAHPCAKEKRAVVLSHDSLLMPVLHHIPEKNINISLGYPLSRSLLSQLIERILAAREGMDNHGAVHWKSLITLIRHPYIRMLTVPSSQNESKNGDNPANSRNLRPFLSRMEHKLRHGARMVDAALCAKTLADDLLGDLEGAPLPDSINESTGTLLEKTMHILVSNWKTVDTLEKTAECLRALCTLLLENGRHIWTHFPLDAECLARLMQHVIPSFSQNAMSEERLSLGTLFSIIRQSLAEQRVPFEADPLTGLQILGTLETRLLHFDRVYLLDLTEDALPGAPSRDPLLPDSLRATLKLPNNHQRELLAAHTFHRLIAGAKEVFLYWQEGVQTGVMDGKKLRSRFIEEAIWNTELQQKKRISEGTGILRISAFPIATPPVKCHHVIERSDSIHTAMQELLSRAVSPSMIDEYLTCPARFFYHRLCHLQEQEEVLEGDDHIGVGNLLHTVLYRALTPFVGQTPQLDPYKLEEIFWEELNNTELVHNLPAQSRFMLESSGPKRLKDFAANQPKILKILHLEHQTSSVIESQGHHIILQGTIDRMDLRPQGLVILDYKTGSISKPPHAQFWNNELLWESLSSWQPNDDRNDPLPELASHITSVQLPCYLYICGHDPKHIDLLQKAPLADAALIQLAERGDEISLFDSTMKPEERTQIITQRIPLLLNTILRHMAEAPVFQPRQTNRCSQCPYYTLCTL